MDVGARKYDPAAGLFISVDPVLDAGDPQTLNGYVYCGGDPVNATDPTGELRAVDGVSGSASYLGGVLARRKRAEQRQYDQLASAVENRQLEDCGCHLATMRAIAGEYHNPVYVEQQVSRYDATAAYDARMIRQGEQARAAAAARARQGGGDCGVFSVVCSVGKWAGRQVAHHWRGLAQIGIIVGTVVAAGACAAVGPGCAALLAGAAGIAPETAGLVVATLFGIGSSDASYAVSSGKKPGWGWVKASAFGGLAGMAGGEADGLMSKAGGGILARTAAQFTARAGTNGIVGMFNAAGNPQEDQTPAYLLGQAGMAGARAFAVPVGALMGA